MASPRDLTASSLAGMLDIAPSNTTTPGPDNPEKELRNWSSLIGIVTAIVGNILIALALNVQRYAHIRLHRERARIKERARLAERRTASPEHNTSRYGALNSNGPPADQRPRTSYFDGVDETWGRNGGGRSPHGVVPPGGGEEEDDDSKAPASSYLRSPYWWLGQVLISLGEMGNFLAYGFAPASIVSPIGVVALISNCIIAPMLFNETFRQRDFWGVAIAVGGVVTVVLSANQQETKLEPHDVWDAITTLEFEIYLGVTGFLIVALMWISSAFHRRTILVDLGLVGLFGTSPPCFLTGASRRTMRSNSHNRRWLHGAGYEGRLVYAVVYALAGVYHASDICSYPRTSLNSYHADSLCQQGPAAVRLDSCYTHTVCHVHLVCHRRERGALPGL